MEKLSNCHGIMDASISKTASSKSRMRSGNLIGKVSFALCATVLFFNSCVSSNRAYHSSPVIARNVTLDPIKADITVDESRKLQGQSTASYFLCFKINGSNSFADGIRYSMDAMGYKIKSGRLNKIRSAAAFQALQTGDYDVLVHPTYETKIENFIGLYKVYTVKVSGYGAKYSNFRAEPQKVIITSNGNEYLFPDK